MASSFSNTAAIVVAAGRGTRLGGRVPKAFVRLGDRPLVAHCLKALEQSSWVDSIVLVVHRSAVGMARRRWLGHGPYPKIRAVVAGGKTRQESVSLGLRAVGKDARTVLVHDAARPFVTQTMVRDVVRRANAGECATVGVPVTHTIKRVDNGGLVQETPPRKTLWEIHTPQAFPRRLLWQAHRRAGNGAEATDDASLVERLGRRGGRRQRVRVLPGSACNIKITTKEDLALAKTLLGRKGRAGCA